MLTFCWRIFKFTCFLKQTKDTKINTEKPFRKCLLFSVSINMTLSVVGMEGRTNEVHVGAKDMFGATKDMFKAKTRYNPKGTKPPGWSVVVAASCNSLSLQDSGFILVSFCVCVFLKISTKQHLPSHHAIQWFLTVSYWTFINSFTEMWHLANNPAIYINIILKTLFCSGSEVMEELPLLETPKLAHIFPIWGKKNSLLGWWCPKSVT